MPYPNEHSCRLKDPNQYDSFAREKCGQKHDDKCIDVIYGMKDGEEGSEIQALRYDIKIWTESAARSHCESREGKFEPAEESKDGPRSSKQFAAGSSDSQSIPFYASPKKGFAMTQFKYRSEKNAEAVSRLWGKPLNKPDWYSIKAQDKDETEIIVYDVIGWPYIDADTFIRDLANIKTGKITVRINSPGGDVFDGIAIFNALIAHKAKVITRIEGLASSIASVLAVAGDEVQAYKSAMFMIHDPWILAIGNQYDLRGVADILEKIGKNMIDIYADNSNVGKRDLKQMMKDETWFTAKEAHERGFIDSILDPGLDTGEEATAKFDLSIFANAPADLSPKGDLRQSDQTTDDGVIDKRTLEHALRDVGLSQSKAKAVLARGYAAIDEEEAREQVMDATERLLQSMTS